MSAPTLPSTALPEIVTPEEWAAAAAQLRADRALYSAKASHSGWVMAS